jgi:hypothetical protein
VRLLNNELSFLIFLVFVTSMNLNQPEFTYFQPTTVSHSTQLMSQTTCIPVSSRFWVATPHLVFTLRLFKNYTWLKRKAFPVWPWNAYDHNLMLTLEMSSLRAVRCVLQYLQVYMLLPSKYSTNTLVMRIIILANIQRIGGNKGALIRFNYLLGLILKITSS